jgi:arylsulfatase A-like enzyme
VLYRAARMLVLVRPNVLLIVFDTARADAFEPYGAPAGSSPAIRQLASQGSAHEAFATAPWTVPSHASMFSGLLPEAAGVPGPDPENMTERTLAALPALRDRWLPTVMSAAGYQTAGVSTNIQVSPVTGFDMGFDDFSYVAPARCAAMTDNSLHGRAQWSLEALRARADNGAAEVERTLAGWLGTRPRAPFFWFVNLIECHSPYLPPLPYSPFGPIGRLRASAEARRHLTQMRLWRGSAGGYDIPEAAIARMRALYQASVSVVDDWLARVLDALDRHGLLDETIVVATSDHGENLGEGNLIGHVFSLDDRLLRVPMVVSGPAAPVPGPRFSHLDLAAWLADSCGLADAPWDPAGSRDVAVAQFTAPGEPGDPRADAVAEAWGLGAEAVATLTTSLRCATNGHRKLLRRGLEEKLIDLDTDRLEVSPSAIGPDQEERYRAELVPLRAALDEADRQAPPPAAEGRAEPGAQDLEALKASLRTLGYL